MLDLILALSKEVAELLAIAVRVEIGVWPGAGLTAYVDIMAERLLVRGEVVDARLVSCIEKGMRPEVLAAPVAKVVDCRVCRLRAVLADEEVRIKDAIR